uniref:Uncharacterized protein n=1 Tax=Pelusios castaneus TaxID=367368 RepID=A0A8C8STU1_9SAUR
MLGSSGRSCAFFSVKVQRKNLPLNIGLPSHLIHRCRRWPAYTVLTSPTVKVLIEQDEQRKAGSQGTSQECREGMGSCKRSGSHTPGQKPSNESQEATFTATTQESSRSNEESSPLRIARGLPANTEVPSPNGHKVIFSRKPPFRVLPYGTYTSPSKESSHKKNNDH